MPRHLSQPVFALAADPAGGALLVGTASGGIFRSGDGGASWSTVWHGPGHAVQVIAFSPVTPGLVLAGTRGDGVLVSSDAGITWRVDPGAEGATVRAFAFASSVTVAGTDKGLLTKPAGGSWTPVGLSQLSVSAIAAAAVNDPARLVAGADATTGQESLPLYETADGGSLWSALTGPPAGTDIVSTLAAGPLPRGGTVRPLIMGTNAGAFLSKDDGSSWSSLTALPATDFNQAAFVDASPDHFYVASDGGASKAGGLWYTGDGGKSFRSLAPPIPSVTALSVIGGPQPVVYAATLRGADQAVTLWTYHDAGGKPSTAPGAVPPVAARTAGATAPLPAAVDWRVALLRGPEAPYLFLGLAAGMVLLVALGTYLRRARP
ncbi:MAG: WD40/YVTN/BNR-like repeat-containing protein [Candidatus Dormibacterales bacterium]